MPDYPALTIDVDQIEPVTPFSGTPSCQLLPPEDLDELFFPEGVWYVPPAAKRICDACPVKVECREWAKVLSGGHGVWAGEFARDILREVQLDKRGNSKLTAAKVRELRDRRNDGWTHQALSVEYGVSIDAVRDVIHRRTWADVA